LPQKLFSDFSEKKISGRYFGGKREILPSRFFRLFYLFKWSAIQNENAAKKFRQKIKQFQTKPTYLSFKFS
jgi:hypothetical protein